MDENITTRSVVVEREMPHAVQKIWRALTQGALLEEWIMANDFLPVVGHHFTFRTTPVEGWDGIIQCEVLEVEPHSKLAYRWESAGLKTIVEWVLEPTDKGTRLRMEQSGFGADAARYYNGAKYGWEKFIHTLEQVLEKME